MLRAPRAAAAHVGRGAEPERRGPREVLSSTAHDRPRTSSQGKARLHSMVLGNNIGLKQTRRPMLGGRLLLAALLSEAYAFRALPVALNLWHVHVGT